MACAAGAGLPQKDSWLIDKHLWRWGGGAVASFAFENFGGELEVTVNDNSQPLSPQSCLLRCRLTIPLLRP